MVLVLALTCIYALPGLFTPEQVGDVATDNASFHLDEEEVLRQLKQKTLNSINKNLLKKVSDNKLTGAVDVIITLSDGSLLGQYNTDNKGMDLETYLSSGEVAATEAKVRSRQNTLARKLLNSGLISSTKYNYSTLLDGFSARTTYENLSKIINYSGVYRVIISNTYNRPQEAVVNDVNVYDTGIFKNNVSDKYTGKGTIVAVLDTGCDYAHPAFTTHLVDAETAHYDRDDIAKLLPGTKAYQLSGGDLEAREVYYGNLTKNKIAFGYDYADKDPDVMPFLESHGTHVAGIIAGFANDMIVEKNDDFDGDPTTTLQGVAIDAQLAIMKVFSDSRTGAEDEDILAALEDCVHLQVDAINMSLGSSCGFTREVDEEYKNDIYDAINDAGISLIVAASNDYSSAYGSEYGNTNKVENPDSGTVGAPSTYRSALSVASINGNKDKYMLANGKRTIFFQEAADMNSDYYDFFEKLGVTDSEDHTFEYVTIPGLGAAGNYASVNVQGKIALVKRGDINFEDKVIYAANAGAAGIIIYNNVYGDILMTVAEAGENIAVCSIGKDDGEYLASEPSGTLVMNAKNTAGPFMSDFSSWGPNPDLTLKPDITAHGGNIWSSIPGGGYEKLSGTSMATPNLCGIAVLARQYVNEKFPKITDLAEKRDLVNQIMMSTATIALNREGNPYSPRKQGAGIADILKLTTTPAYIYTMEKDADTGDLVKMNTTKLELFDDPARKGVYDMTFYLVNISDKAVSYKLGNYTMTESLSADKKYVAEMAYMLSPNAQYSVEEGGTYSDGIVTVQPEATAKITVRITLNGSDKKYLNESFANGMYVEGYITLDNQSTESDSVDLNVPFLAFYGDWSQAPIFDKDYYDVETTAHNNALEEDEKVKADYAATTPYALYYYDYIIPMGTFLYDLSSDFTPIPATEEHAALAYSATSLSGIYAVYTGLLRGAKEMTVTIRNTSTGEVVWTMKDYNCYKAHYNGTPMPYVCEFDLPMFGDNLTLDGTGSIMGAFGNNNEHFEVTMQAKLDWDVDRNINDTYTFSFYIDNESPTVVGSRFYTKYDNTARKDKYYVDLEVYDNHYAMSVRPIIVDWAYDGEGNHQVNQNGEQLITVDALSDTATPVYQETRGSTTKVTIEITDYMDRIHNSLEPNCILFQVDDYALNTNLISIPLPETDNKNLDFDKEKLGDTTVYDGDAQAIELDIGQTFDLTQYIKSTVENYTISADAQKFLFMLDWNSENDAVAAISNGVVEGRGEGTTNVYFTSGGTKHKIQVKVSSEVSDQRQPALEELKLLGYYTVKAFTSDIDRSEIGSSGSTNYFDKSRVISFYPSEVVKLQYKIKPWNLEQNKDRYEVTWTSTDPRVATVDANGVVTAVKEGTCYINLSIKIDGRTSVMQASCFANVKSEFIIENRQLVAYKGAGGEVVLPDDEGLMYISSYAFCHYEMDNSAETPEDDKYNLDYKRTPYSNTTVTKVVIPETVTTIEQYAFYQCFALETVEIKGDKLTTIGHDAFAKCSNLKSINLGSVNVINDNAFKDCKELSDVGEEKLAHPYVVGESAFENCTSLVELNLTNLRRGGKASFKGCVGLEKVTFGEFTRIGESMFEGCVGLTHVNRDNSPNTLFVYSDVVPSRAFYGCIKLKGVVFKNTVTYLGEEAFRGCTALELVKFEQDCEEFGTNAFTGCSSIDNFTIANYHMEGGVVYDSTSKTKLLLVVPTKFNQTTFTLPASVKEIAAGAFSGVGIKSFDVADSSVLETIGNNAFAGCAALTSVTLPSSVKEIGSGAFAQTALGSIDLHETQITKLADELFSGSSVQTVTLPDACKEIGESAFEACTQLESVYGLENVTTVGNRAFCLAGISSVQFGSDVTIGEEAFAGNTRLANVTFGGKVYVGDEAFAESGLTSLNISGEGSYVGVSAFARCNALNAVNIDGVTTIGDNAFYYCEQLTSVSADGAERIGVGSFEGCRSLQTVSAENATEVGDAAFYPYTYTENGGSYIDTSLETVSIPKAEVIGADAFAYAVYATNIEMPSVKKIGNNAFYRNRLLTELDAPDLEEIGDMAFLDCESLASVNAPKLKSIGSQAFGGTAITTIDLPSTITTVKESVTFGATSFAGFTLNGDKNGENDHVKLDNGVLYTKNANGGYTLISYPQLMTPDEDDNYTVLEGTTRIGMRAAANNALLKTVTLPQSLVSIGDYAFAGCTDLSKVIFQSYYAPDLESVINLDDEILATQTSRYPGFNDLYKYDFYVKFEDAGTISYYYGNLFAYRHFRGLVTSFDKNKLEMVIPSNSEGYDSPIYKAFFGKVTLGTNTMGKAAIDFVEAVKALMGLEKIDRYAYTAMDKATMAYNVLLANQSELSWVDEEYLNFYNQALSDYNIDLALDAINKLTEMDDTVHSYRMLSDALRKYNELSSEEKGTLDGLLGEVGAAQSILNEKSAAYKEAAGITGSIDLSKEYIDRVVDQLEALLGGLTPETITSSDFNKLLEAYKLVKTLTDDEYKTNQNGKLDPYLKILNAWETAAYGGLVNDLAETVAHPSATQALAATIISVNALLAAAFVALKGGIR